MRHRSTWRETTTARRRVYDIIAEANLNHSDMGLRDIALEAGVTYDVAMQKVNNLILRGKVTRQCRYRVVT